MGKRVLVADDDELITRSCARLLQPHCTVEVATSVSAALRIIGDGAPLDGVWSDRHFPEGRGGVHVLRAAAERHPNAVLVLVTGDTNVSGLDELPAQTRVFHKDQVKEALHFFIDAITSLG